MLRLFELSSSIVFIGVIGFSGDQTTFNFLMPRFFSSLLMTLERGSVSVEKMSEMRNWVGSSLFPAPMEEISGMPILYAVSASASLPETVAMASAM